MRKAVFLKYRFVFLYIKVNLLLRKQYFSTLVLTLLFL